jgi:hypothetical protein
MKPQTHTPKLVNPFPPFINSDLMRIAGYSKEASNYIIRAVSTHEEMKEILIQLANWFQGSRGPVGSTLFDDEKTWSEKVVQAIARAEGI